MITLDHESTVPLYIQIKEYLRGQIESAALAAGARLPSERELAKQFGVSRMTAREALHLLAQDGYVLARVGKGTFVRNTQINQELRFLSSFTEDVRQRGMTPSSILIQARTATANKEIASRLKIATGARIVVISRARLADGEPIAWEICHVNARLCPGILDHHDFSRESLYQVLRDQYGYRLVWADQSIGARMPDEREQEILKLDDATPVLNLARVTYTDDDVPVEYVRSVYRCDRYQLRIVLHSSHKP